MFFFLAGGAALAAAAVVFLVDLLGVGVGVGALRGEDEPLPPKRAGPPGHTTGGILSRMPIDRTYGA